jgi:citrate lyase beta subunit
MTTRSDDAVLAALVAGLPARLDAAPAPPPGPADLRRPVHTVYGGAHLFAHDVAGKLGDRARRHLEEWAPDFATFARAVGLTGSDRLPSVTAERQRLAARIGAEPEAVRRSEPQAFLAHTTYERMRAKLAREPVEDYRIDFEDGFGVRSDAEEDECAAAAAESTARGVREGTLPPFLGIRIKPFAAGSHARAARTLERFFAALLARGPDGLPANFAITLPKVTQVEQVAALADCCDALERHHALPAAALRIEIMIETPESVLAPDGTVPLRRFVAAARGRCRGAHFGAYDYTAACGIAASHQSLSHPACGFARQVMLGALAGSGLALSDGAVTLLPVPPHRAAAGAALTPLQLEANRAAVHRAWKAHFDEVRRALREGFDQGWDLHPGQLPTRHAAVASFFLEGRDEAAERLASFVTRAAKASRHGNVVEDAATGQGLLNFFLRGLACGALDDREALATGLTLDELRSRSFAHIVERRRAGG